MASPKGFEEIFAAREAVVASGTPGNYVGHPAGWEWFGVTQKMEREIRWRRPDMEEVDKAAWLETLSRANYDNDFDLTIEAERIANAIRRVQEVLREQPTILLYENFGAIGKRTAQVAKVRHVDGLHIVYGLRLGEDGTNPYVHIGIEGPITLDGPFDRIDISDIESAACSPDEAAVIDVEAMLGDHPDHLNSQLIIGDDTISTIITKVACARYSSTESLERARFFLDQVLTQRSLGATSLQTEVMSV